MGAQTRTDVLPYISLIPVFGVLIAWDKYLYSRVQVYRCFAILHKTDIGCRVRADVV